MLSKVKVMAKYDGYVWISAREKYFADENTAPIAGPNMNPSENAMPTRAYGTIIRLLLIRKIS